MSVFVDTSAFYALLDEDDEAHAAAAEAFRAMRGRELQTHAYVVVESIALVTRRLGGSAADRFVDGVLPVVRTEPVDLVLHLEALAAYRASGSKRVSFVDRTSFAFMRRAGIHAAFAIDADFGAEGFEVIDGR